jgi:hypothetical protein
MDKIKKRIESKLQDVEESFNMDFGFLKQIHGITEGTLKKDFLKSPSTKNQLLASACVYAEFKDFLEELLLIVEPKPTVEEFINEGFNSLKSKNDKEAFCEMLEEISHELRGYI